MDKKEIQKIAYNYFGKKPYIYAGGDWGTYKPGYKNLKIVQKSSKIYEISFTNVMGSYENKKISRKIGKTTFQLKKTSKSSYGYIITRIEYKGYEVKL